MTPNKKSRICYKGFMVTYVHENLRTNHPLRFNGQNPFVNSWEINKDRAAWCITSFNGPILFGANEREQHGNGANEAKLKLLIDAWNYQIILISLYGCFFFQSWEGRWLVVGFTSAIPYSFRSIINDGWVGFYYRLGAGCPLNPLAHSRFVRTSFTSTLLKN